MVLIGISWLVFWLLVEVFTVTLMHAALATALIFIVLGLLVEGVPPWERRP